MTNEIKHRGTVVGIEGAWVKVKILQISACSSCSVKGVCHASESKEKIVDVYAPDSKFVIGENVMLVGSTSMGMKAVVWAFVLPFLILWLVLFLTIHVTNGNEFLSAILSLLVLVPYYLILYLFRHQFKKRFAFTIKSITN